MDMCHLQNAEVEPKFQKYRAQRKQCKRRIWSLSSLLGTRLVCVPDDCCKSNGLYCKITRLWWTSSWSIRILSSKIGGWSQTAQDSQIGMSRCLDTSSTTQMAKIMGTHWRSRGTSWTKFIRASICRIAMGETIRTSFIWTRMEENTELGMYVRSPETRHILVSMCGRYQNGW